MGYKGVLRTIAAESRRQEREARRRQRELERRQKQIAKMQELERAQYEVDKLENYIEVITSIHKECGDHCDWEIIQQRPEPKEPQRDRIIMNVQQALLEKKTYSPSRKDRLMRRVDSRRKELDEAVEIAQRTDQKIFQFKQDKYLAKHREWVELQELSSRILANEPEAFTFAIELFNPFGEIAAIGSHIKFHTETGQLFEVSLKANGEEIIPSETKTLHKSGKLSVKKMTKSRFYEIYQDHVCGCALRISRELFALLPTSMVIVTAKSDLLNTSTGHFEEQPILSVAIPRATVDRLNIEALDPSDSMLNFVHNMKFLKTKGFQPVAKIEPSELETAI